MSKPIPHSEEIAGLKASFENLQSVTHVEARIRDGPTGEYVEFALYIEKGKQTEMHINNVLKRTSIPEIFSPKTLDAWYPQGERPNTPVLVCTLGMNPDASQNPPVEEF